MRLKIANLHRAFRLDERFLGLLARDILRRVRVTQREISVVFLTKARMRELNRQFRHRDAATDVLSFRLEGGSSRSRASFGDVFISPDAARENADAFNSSFEKEIVLYVIHGILHLAGYDDTRPRERARMRKKEEELLTDLCRARDLSRVSTRL